MKSLLMITLAVLLLAGTAAARQMSASVKDVTELLDGAGTARVLFRLEPAERLDGMLVSRATVTFQAVGAPTKGPLRLRVYPVTTVWSAGAVSWTSGWSRAGGDYDDEIYVPVEMDLSSGSATVELDLTPLVKEAVEGGAATDGFILTTDPAVASGIAAADVTGFFALSAAAVDIRCREAPSAGPRVQR
ncbi:MAG: hypothetical protein ACT4PE_03035 [Candidatus Eiseniibacteriota bacterium]